MGPRRKRCPPPVLRQVLVDEYARRAALALPRPSLDELGRLVEPHGACDRRRISAVREELLRQRAIPALPGRPTTPARSGWATPAEVSAELDRMAVARRRVEVQEHRGHRPRRRPDPELPPYPLHPTVQEHRHREHRLGLAAAMGRA